VPDAGAPGRVLDARPEAVVVACGEQALQLLEVQWPGGRRQPAATLLQRHRLTAGQLLCETPLKS
jgi:methionyl-tRNA formyltransferase